jgi:DNA-binding transcriptional regulator YdaS (Cro superfamily)
MDKSAIERACDALGGQVKLAKALGVTPQAVSQWVAKGRVPPERCAEVERASGVGRHELRPDIFEAAA